MRTPKRCYVCREPGQFLLARRWGLKPCRAVCRRHIGETVGVYTVVASLGLPRPARTPLRIPSGHLEQVARLLGWSNEIASSVDSGPELPMVAMEPGAVSPGDERSS